MSIRSVLCFANRKGYKTQTVTGIPRQSWKKINHAKEKRLVDANLVD
jgi:hypothetical protein